MSKASLLNKTLLNKKVEACVHEKLLSALFDFLICFFSTQTSRCLKIQTFSLPSPWRSQTLFQRSVVNRKPWSLEWAMLVHSSATQKPRKSVNQGNWSTHKKTFYIFSPEVKNHTIVLSAYINSVFLWCGLQHTSACANDLEFALRLLW